MTRTNVPECRSLWDWGNVKGSSMILGGMQQLLKCDALPADVLESEFSLETWRNCELQSRQYNYVSPTSSKSGTPSSVVTTKDQFMIDKPSLGEKQPEAMRQRCQRFRDVIEKMCNTCEGQASGDGAKSALSKKCEAITMPAAMEVL